MIKEGVWDTVKGFLPGGQKFANKKEFDIESVRDAYGIHPDIQRGASNFRVQLRDKVTIPVNTNLVFQLSGMRFWVDGVMGNKGNIMSSSDSYSKNANAIGQWWTAMVTNAANPFYVPNANGANVKILVKW